VGPIILGLLIAGALILLLAKYAPSAAARRLDLAERRAGRPLGPRIAPRDFQRLVKDLLTRGMALEIESEEVQGDEARLVLRRRGDGLPDALYVALVVGDPPGQIVDQARVVELEQTLTALGAAGAFLFTPYRVDLAGLPALRGDLEVIDGARFRQLVARHLPERVGELSPLPA
jgi:hypothetical protein